MEYISFEQFLINTDLFKNTTRQKYLGAINTISEDMKREKILKKSLIDIKTLEEFENLYNKIIKNNFFEVKDKIGHHMYSAALKHYKDYLIYINEVSEIEINKKAISLCNEEFIENFLNYEDESAQIVTNLKFVKQRKYNQLVLKKLKSLYKNTCQICAINMEEKYGCSILECHHIEPFSVSQNNNCNNILVLCPNCHRQIHKLKLNFQRDKLTFYNDKGFLLKVKLNKHLC